MPTPCTLSVDMILSLIKGTREVIKDILVYLEHGAQLGDQGHAPRPEVLPDGDLLEEDGHAAEGHGHGVHEQEGACKRRRLISKTSNMAGLVH